MERSNEILALNPLTMQPVKSKSSVVGAVELATTTLNSFVSNPATNVLATREKDSMVALTHRFVVY